MKAVHYAEVASALGAVRLAEATGNPALLERVADRGIAGCSRRTFPTRPTMSTPMSTVSGRWLLGGADNRARGLLMADGQWRETTADGLTAQARYWIDDIWMIGALQVQAWRTTRDPRYLDRAALTARLYIARLQQPDGLFHHGPEAPLLLGARQWLGRRGAGRRSCPSCPPIIRLMPRSSPGYRRMMAATASLSGRTTACGAS